MLASVARGGDGRAPSDAFDAGDFPVFYYSEPWGPTPRFDRVDPRPFFEDHVVRDGYHFYAPASGFVTYLLSRHGPEKLLRLHERLGYTSSADKFHDEFAEIYGLDVDDEVAIYTGDGGCPDDATEVPQPIGAAAARRGVHGGAALPQRARSHRCPLPNPETPLIPRFRGGSEGCRPSRSVSVRFGVLRFSATNRPPSRVTKPSRSAWSRAACRATSVA